MSKANRTRVDYMPSFAAVQALQAAQKPHPDHNIQRMIDRLIITGVSALAHGRWEPPRLYGRDREQWVLPVELRRPEPDPAR